MNFLKRLFGGLDKPVVPLPNAAATPPKPTALKSGSKSPPHVPWAAGAKDDDITLIDPVANDRWHAEKADANPAPAPPDEKKT